jgi:transcriptional repressor NrdR
VIDSRSVDEGAAIRRRRECVSCGRRFTTFERAEDLPLVVTKRSGHRVAFASEKIVGGVTAACKGRPVGEAAIRAVAAEVEELVRRSGPGVTTETIGRAVLDRLRRVDHVAYLRFASVHKGFDNAEDFLRELRLLEGVDQGV